MKSDTRYMPWRNRRWAIKFSSLHPDKAVAGRPMLIGVSWGNLSFGIPRYPGEPPRALMFDSRQAARTWARGQMAKYRGRKDCCQYWRFKPVQVIEQVEVQDAKDWLDLNVRRLPGHNTDPGR